ncbi:methionyl aminopeptidase [Psychrobacillus sp. FJAT-21963]|uniref:methionyl aminopeptidase n=1 Tax=Psychrobacillus sp. FJAT-21963 TaxID=1712028 RepID=UPI00209FAAF6|nr:SEC-C metal-binding domain-containing protein [Psychrobacillus sp. FJAT-21963]
MIRIKEFINEKCICGSGKKYKKCCGNKKSLSREKFESEMFYNYYIVYDNQKVRKKRDSMHLYTPILGDTIKAFWYCLHLPRHCMDLIVSPDGLFAKGDGYQQHNIYLIGSNVSDIEIQMLTNNPPTLYIYEDEIKENEDLDLHKSFPSLLGCIFQEDISDEILNEHWSKLKDNTMDIIKEFDIERLPLTVKPRLLSNSNRYILPNLFMINQYGDGERSINFLVNNVHDARKRGLMIKKTVYLANAYHSYGNRLNDYDIVKFQKIMKENSPFTPTALIVTLPGGPKYRKSFDTYYKEKGLSFEEDELIKFFGVQRSIALQGVYMEGQIISSEVFALLSQLEKHFYLAAFNIDGKVNPKYVERVLRKFGKVVAKLFEKPLNEFILASSTLVAFTDFPIGLAILPGFSDPLCNIIPISYRPLTPLTLTYQYGITKRNDFYLQQRKNFKVLIIECLDSNDRIRKIADMTWEVIKNQSKKYKFIEIFYEEVNSSVEIKEVLEKYSSIHMLILSAHGSYDENGVAGIIINDEIWLPDVDIRVPPIVILSACHVAVKGNGNYTISEAFLRCGALATLGTLIPVGVKKNGVLIQQFLLYVSEVLDGKFECRNLSEAWFNAINYGIVTEILGMSPKLERWFLTPREIDGKLPAQEYHDKAEKNRIKRGNFHQETIKLLLSVAEKDQMDGHLKAVLNSKGYIAESVFYTFAGYPEKIRFIK